MKQRISLIVVMAVVLALGLGTATGVNAANTAAGAGISKVTGNTGAQGVRTGGMGTLNQPVQASGGSDKEYMPNAALVMFKSSQKLTKKGAKKTLQFGAQGIEDIQVEDLWTFTEDPVTVASDSGTRKGFKASGKNTDAGAQVTGSTEQNGGSTDQTTKQAAGSTKGASVNAGSTNQTYGSIVLVKSKTLSTQQLVRQMQARSDVLYAEPNYKIHAYSVNDPYFNHQWSMQGGAEGTAAYRDTTPNVQAVWDQGTTGSERIVAVVDTGVDYTHPDLAQNMWHNTHQPTLKGEFGYDFNAGDTDPMDEHGHGTHCAGIIGAQGNNGLGISGVNQQVKIMALRILDADGSAYLSHEVAAYNYINKALDLGEPVQAINNSWGGGDYSQIFEELVNIVGAKGAITVCAAGNDGSNNDLYGDYPSCIRSPYLLSVAATREDGELVSFSNYGKETVDTAAPGTDILSTVSYDCYNPTIYGSSQTSLSAGFNSYESSGSWGSAATLGRTLMVNGEAYTGSTGQPTISISEVSGGFLDEKGHALQIEAKKMRANDLVCLTIPYQLEPNASVAPSFSVMGRAKATSNEMGLLAAVDVPQGTDLDLGTLGDLGLPTGFYLYKDDNDNWAHMEFETTGNEDLEEDQQAYAAGKETLDPSKREIVLILYAGSPGSVTVQLDDMGLSRQDLGDTSAFGKYDFYSGTSMATPFVTGAVALLAAQEGFHPELADAAALANEVVSHAKAGTLPIAQKGSLDFTKKPVELGPRIGNITVDKAGGTITIGGSGLNPSTGLTVQIGASDAQMQTAAIVSQTDSQVVIEDKGWINNVENIRLTGYGGKQSARSDLYLVKGKKGFDLVKNAEDETTGEAMATDGRYIYNVDSTTRSVLKIDTKHLSEGAERLAQINAARLFGSDKNENAMYAVQFGNDLVYMNGKLYTVVEYGEADESEEDDEVFFFGKDSSTGRVTVVYDEDGDEMEGGMSIYSGSYRLVSIDAKTGKVQNLGKLPAALTKTEDYTMAAYNGKLMFMGGYSYETGDLTSDVRVFDPAKKRSARWSTGKALPQVRAGGKAVQTGSKLIYTMGYAQPGSAGDENLRLPANLIYNGKSWSISAAGGDKAVEPLLLGDSVRRGGKEYPTFDASVCAAKNGLLYLGMPAANVGDTFLYDATADAYRDSGYNFVTDLYDDGIRGIAVGSKVYGFDGMSVYTAKVPGVNDLVKITVKKNAGGTVTGTKSVPAGSNAKLTVKAKKGYKIKSIKVGAKRVVLKKNATRKSFTLKRLTTNQTVKVVFAKK